MDRISVASWGGVLAGQAPLQRPLEQQGEHAECDVGTDLAIVVVPHGAKLGDALDRLEVLLDGVLRAIQAAKLGRSLIY